MAMRASKSTSTLLVRCVHVIALASSARVVASALRSPDSARTATILSNRPLGQRGIPSRLSTRILSEAPPDVENRPLRLLSSVVDEKQSSISLSKCSVTIIEPTTGCEVVLVGCFHGSPASAQDVASTLLNNPPDALALELCPDRFATIREKAQEEDARAAKPDRSVGIRQTWSSQQGDWALRGVDGLLRFVSNAQSTFFSGLEPGLEFVTAVRCCPQADVVLADQPVHETLYKLSRLPGGSPWKAADSHRTRSGVRSPLQETLGLFSALFGSNEIRACGYQPVNLFEFGMRTREAQVELAQSVLLPLLLCVGTVLTLPALSAARCVESVAIPHGPEVALSQLLEFDNLSLLYPPLFLMTINVALVLAFYVGLVVPVVRVVLSERDDCLARGIRAACRVASAKDDGDVLGKPPVRRVTAVLGLLHVNGVAQRLLQDNEAHPGFH